MNQPSQPVADPQPIVPVETATVPVPATQLPVQGPSVVLRLLSVLKREPVMFLTLAYLFVSFLGLWSSFWFYRRFEVPILEYMQSSDFFVAGLRRPQFMLLLSIALFWLWLSAWPIRWADRNQERAAEYRKKHWWGKYFFPVPRSWGRLGHVSNETMLAVSFIGLSLYAVYTFSLASARDVLQGKSQTQRVKVSLSTGGATPVEASLLGTSSAFVFLWRTDTQRAEVVPIESIARIQSLDPPQPLPKSPTTSAAKPAP